jgi:hypothetical protein
MKRFIIIMVGVGLLTGVLAAPAAARTRIVPYYCEETPAGVIEEGTTTFSPDGTVMHVRGLVLEYTAAGHRMCAGDLEIGVNFDYDFEEAEGMLWGATQVSLTAFKGGFEMRWVARFINDDPFADDATNIWVGTYRGDGYGELEGWHVRSVILEKTHSLVADWGIATRR